MLSTTQPCDLESLSAEELCSRLRGLETLLDVTRVLAGEVDLSKILETIAAESCHALDCERASVYQYDPLGEELYTRAVTQLEINEIRHSISIGIAGDVARLRQVANVNDPHSDPRWNSAIDQATGFQTRNILAGPLVSPHDGSLLGVLQLINKRRSSFGTFDEDLLRAFCQHAAVAIDRARLVDELRQRGEIDASLNVARDVQRGFMPTELPDMPGYETATWWYPNQAVGGDYCDVLPLCDGRMALVIADVSGHGLGPSLIMASVRAALRALVLEHSAAKDLIELLSRALAGDLQEGRFITLMLAEIDPSTHRLEYANAGHAPAIHFKAAEQIFEPLPATGFPLGVVDADVHAGAPLLQLDVGDLLVLCTDGIVEAMNAAAQPFGQRRLERIIRDCAKQPVSEIVREVGRQVELHYAGESPPDDLTILATRRNA